MRYILLSLLLVTATVVHADPFRDGVVAYQQEKYSKALEAWLPLAESGHVLAQTLVGSMYAYGEGVTQDDAEAFKWLSLAAESNSAQAQYNLAIMYEKGLGVEANITLARKWFKAAAVQGRKDAAARYSLLDDTEQTQTATIEPQPVITKPELLEVETQTSLTEESPRQRIHLVLNSENADELLGPPSAIEDNSLTDTGEHGLAWARAQPLDNYTIQLASSIEPRLIEAFKNHLQLTQHYAKTISEHNNSQWHALIYGSYSSVKEAQKEIDALPARWKTWQPWIKKFSSVSAIKH